MSDVNALYYFMNKALHHVVISFRWQFNFYPTKFGNDSSKKTTKKSAKIIDVLEVSLKCSWHITIKYELLENPFCF